MQQHSEITDTLRYSCGALLIADDHHLSDVLGRKASPVGERERKVSSIVKVKAENLRGTVWAKQCLYFRFKVNKWLTGLLPSSTAFFLKIWVGRTTLNGKKGDGLISPIKWLDKNFQQNSN